MRPNQWVGVVLVAMGIVSVVLGFVVRRQVGGSGLILAAATNVAFGMTLVLAGDAATPYRQACFVLATVLVAVNLGYLARRRWARS